MSRTSGLYARAIVWFGTGVVFSPVSGWRRVPSFSLHLLVFLCRRVVRHRRVFFPVSGCRRAPSFSLHLLVFLCRCVVRHRRVFFSCFRLSACSQLLLSLSIFFCFWPFHRFFTPLENSYVTSFYHLPQCGLVRCVFFPVSGLSVCSQLLLSLSIFLCFWPFHRSFSPGICL